VGLIPLSNRWLRSPTTGSCSRCIHAFYAPIAATRRRDAPPHLHRGRRDYRGLRASARRRPGNTRSNSSEFPPGLPRRCLWRKALYVPLPNPGHAARKFSFEKGSMRLLLSSHLESLYRLRGASLVQPLIVFRGLVQSHRAAAPVGLVRQAF
jgi:hypothetical protein